MPEPIRLDSGRRYVQGPEKDKASVLIPHGASRCETRPDWPPIDGTAYVCVVRNLHWEGALWVKDEGEYRYVTRSKDHGDDRPYTWWVMPLKPLVDAQS